MLVSISRAMSSFLEFFLAAAEDAFTDAATRRIASGDMKSFMVDLV